MSVQKFKIMQLVSLLRLDKPVGYFLVFFPAIFGLFLAGKDYNSFKLLLWLFIGSILTRSAGSIINDIFDRNIDKYVARTKGRPLANNSLSVKTALIVVSILLFLALLILSGLSKTAIYIGFLAVIMMSIYPLMKRITYFPQIFLGFTFNLGALLGYGAVADNITLPSMFIYLACCFWTMGYDTIYGFMDLADDKKIGVKSMAILLEHRNYLFWLALFYTLFFLLFILANILAGKTGFYLFFAVLAAVVIISGRLLKLNIHDPQNCLRAFKVNAYIGALLALGMSDF